MSDSFWIHEERRQNQRLDEISYAEDTDRESVAFSLFASPSKNNKYNDSRYRSLAQESPPANFDMRTPNTDEQRSDYKSSPSTTIQRTEEHSPLKRDTQEESPSNRTRDIVKYNGYRTASDWDRLLKHDRDTRAKKEPLQDISQDSNNHLAESTLHERHSNGPSPRERLSAKPSPHERHPIDRSPSARYLGRSSPLEQRERYPGEPSPREYKPAEPSPREQREPYPAPETSQRPYEPLPREYKHAERSPPDRYTANSPERARRPVETSQRTFESQAGERYTGKSPESGRRLVETSPQQERYPVETAQRPSESSERYLTESSSQQPVESRERYRNLPRRERYVTENPQQELERDAGKPSERTTPANTGRPPTPPRQPTERIPSYMRTTASYQSRIQRDKEPIRYHPYQRPTQKPVREPHREVISRTPRFKSTTKINAMEDIRSEMTEEDVYVPLAVRIKHFEENLRKNDSNYTRPSAARRETRSASQPSSAPSRLTRPRSPKLLTSQRSYSSQRLASGTTENKPRQPLTSEHVSSQGSLEERRTERPRITSTLATGTSRARAKDTTTYSSVDNRAEDARNSQDRDPDNNNTRTKRQKTSHSQLVVQPFKFATDERARHHRSLFEAKLNLWKKKEQDMLKNANSAAAGVRHRGLKRKAV